MAIGFDYPLTGYMSSTLLKAESPEHRVVSAHPPTASAMPPGRGVGPRRLGSQLSEVQFPSSRNSASHLVLASVLVTDTRYGDRQVRNEEGATHENARFNASTSHLVGRQSFSFTGHSRLINAQPSKFEVASPNVSSSAHRLPATINQGLISFPIVSSSARRQIWMA